jgi:glycosyltransferase involved in cell wall biosynthesis
MTGAEDQGAPRRVSARGVPRGTVDDHIEQSVAASGPTERLGETLFGRPELRPFASMSLDEIATTSGLRTIHVVAWRDFDDAEAGGSELHAHRILSAWAKAGIKVVMTTSSVEGEPPVVTRDGYRVTRRLGRYAIFPRTMISGWLGHLGRVDGMVEIWNGMPFLSPLWSRAPKVIFLHHVHAEMWQMVLPRGMAETGHFFEHRMAPQVYRRSRIITLSSSSKEEITESLGLPAANISVVPPGVEPHFTSGSVRSEVPLVVAVGRLVPVKRFHLLIEGLVRLKPRIPELQAVIAGEGYERPQLEALIRANRAEEWISLPGFVSQDELVDLYRRSWVVASSSLREGWGMTVTEAGACGTPAVVSRISGHQDAVADGESGILFDDADGMVDALFGVLTDEVLRKRLSLGASDFATSLSWESTARQTLAVLAAEKLRRGRSSAGPQRRRRA